MSIGGCILNSIIPTLFSTFFAVLLSLHLVLFLSIKAVIELATSCTEQHHILRHRTNGQGSDMLISRAVHMQMEAMHSVHSNK